MMATEVSSLETTRVIARSAELARTPWARLIGLMGRSSLPNGAALVLDPSNSVHTCFMRFPIDVVFVDRDWSVLEIRHSMRPWRLTRLILRAKRVIELPAGTAATAGLAVGDRLSLASTGGSLTVG